MASGQFAAVYRQIGRLFSSGTVAGLSEGQLLDRFVARRDDAAFEAIVARHGPAVLAACRAILRDPNDVDDAFQAVFLVLVRRAGTLRDRESLGPWLYGVSRRVALRARAEAARRDRRRGDGPAPGSGPAALDFDLRPAIHDEVGRLPATYRAAVVLCYLEGLTHEEAARQLGWPVGTVRGRLARARDLLRARLTRRGLALSSGALLSAIAAEADAAVPPGLGESTLAVARSSAPGAIRAIFDLSTSASVASSRVFILAQGASPTMTVLKLKSGAALLVAAGLLSGTGLAAYLDGSPTQGAAGRLPGAADGGSKADVKKSVAAGNAAANAEDDTSPQARIRLIEGLLLAQMKLADAGEIRPDVGTLASWTRWNRRLRDARLDAGWDRGPAEVAYAAIDKKIEGMQGDLEANKMMSHAAAIEARYARIEDAVAARKAAKAPQAPAPAKGGAPAEKEPEPSRKPDLRPRSAAETPKNTPEGGENPPPRPLDYEAIAGDRPEEARLKIAERAVASYLWRGKHSDNLAPSDHIYKWNRRLLDAKLATGRDRAEAIGSFLKLTREVEASARKHNKAKVISDDSFFDAIYERVEAERYVKELPLASGTKAVAPLPTTPTARPSDGEAKLDHVGGKVAPPRQDAPKAGQDNSRGDERVKLAEQILADRINLMRHGEVSVADDTIQRWNRRLLDARLEAGRDRAEAVDAYLSLARSIEDAAKAMLAKGELSRAGYLDARYARIDAEIVAEQSAKAPPAARPEAPVDPNARPAEGAAEVVAGKAAKAPLAQPSASTTGPGGTNPAGSSALAATGRQNPTTARVGAATRPRNNEGPSGQAPNRRKLPKPHPSDADRNKVIEAALETPLKVDFPKGTPLGAILKAIREGTQDEKAGLPDGIPIYVDPFVLIDNVDEDPTPRPLPLPLPVRLEGIPLRTTLRLILNPHDLSYRVRDRLLFIASEELLDHQDQVDADREQQDEWRAKGLIAPGGFGSMGGMG